MIEYLHVKNLALIRESEVEFGEGLNILTGETGAGKSILIGGVALGLGEKVPRDLVSEGEEAFVEIVFRLTGELEERLRELGVESEDHQLILSRRIGARSSAKLNGETVPVSKIREIAGLLLDIHGQRENQTLLKRKQHLSALDGYGGERVAAARASYQTAWRRLQEKEKEWKGLDLSEEEWRRETDLLSFEVKELQEAELREGEDTEAEAAYRRLSNAERIRQALTQAKGLLSEGEVNAGDLVGRALRELLPLSDLSPSLAALTEQLTALDGLLADAARDLSEELLSQEGDPEELYRVERRLDEINRLKTKYRPTIPEILSLLTEKEERLTELLDIEERRERLREERERLLAEARDAAARLTEERKAAAGRLDQEITGALLDLNFSEAVFLTSFGEEGKLGPDGADDVRFLISLNRGEEVRPLETVASGGELSRVMLAFKTIIAEEDRTPTLVFDEIDAGISGRTAQAVSEKLHGLSRHHQILCITHLPQIAAMADTHFVIEKEEEGEGTISRISRLSEEESVEELSRMLGGAKITEAVRQNAREMKYLAREKVQDSR